MQRWMPATTWLRGITSAGLRGDVIAGITLAAYLLPAGLGDASLANLPPEAGLYACLFSGLVFWLFCSSRHTAITVTSAISLLVGSTLGEIADGDTTRFAALAAATGLLTGAIAFIAYIARAGVLVEFISETVLTGFKVGIALVLISTQLPKLCGFHGSHGNFFERIWVWATHLGHTNWIALLLGLLALAMLIAGKRWLKNRPVAVVVLTCAGLLKDLPQPVLAAIVLVAVGGLIKVDVLKRLWRFDRREFAVAALVVTGVLASGILRGVLIGVVVSLALLLKRAARPRVAELGRVPGSQIFADRERHPENQPEPDVLVLRLEGPLIYFNVRHVHDRVLAAVTARPGTRLLVIYLGMTVQLDLAGCEVLEELHHALHHQGVTMRLAEVHGAMRDVVRRGDHVQALGPIEANQTVATVIAAWRAGSQEMKPV